jgi:hypothetical protein
MKRRALVLCIGLLVSISALAYSGGSGTEQNPYLISSKADMEQLSSYVNGGQAYSGIYFKLTQDLTGITTMAGNSNSRYFSGIFDGDGHTLEVNISSTGSYAGVFGYTDGATIKNLGVEGSVTRPAQARDAFVGGICGYAKNTMISNCYNAGTISSSTSYYASFSGGICGECVTGNFIDNCYNIGDISSSGGSDNTYSGGICGDGGTITTCYNTGDISSSSSSYSYSGGICGVMGTIKNCFVADCVISNDKYIDATRTRIGRIGGFGGGGTYTNCYASGDVKLNGDPIGSSDADSKDGKDATLSSFQNQSWIQTNLGWDFQTIWEMSSENGGLPVLKKQGQSQHYTITASAGGGGNILPNGEVSVPSGGSQTFTFTPLSGYEIDQVLVDGANNASAVSVGSYTFSNVTANHSIAVSFKQNQPQTYIIAASAESGGNISPNGNIFITSGGSQTFTFTPLSGYEIDQVLVDSVNNASAISAGSYTFSNVTTNHSITVSFTQTQPQVYTITASAGAGGNVSPSGNVSITSGGSQTFTFTPLSSYKVEQVLIDGANNAPAAAAGSYTFSNVTANHSIAVSFKQNQQQTYIIAASAGTGGDISPSGNISVTSGDSQTFTFTPLSSYKVEQVLIDGVNNAPAAAAGSYTFSNVTANHSIAVSFKQNQQQT